MDKKNDLEIRLDFLEKLLERNLSWVSAADSKIPAIFTIDIAMLGFLCALAPKVDRWTICGAIFSSLAGLALLGSVVFLALNVFPRLKGPKGSIVYFGSIVQYSEDTFIKKVLAELSEEILEDFARQIYRNAEIASKKFEHVRWAIIFMLSSVPFWLVAITLLYIER